MASALIRRFCFAAILLLAVCTASFALLRLLPGDFALALLTAQMDGDLPGDAALARFRAEQGFDDPLPLQYLRWLGDAARGELGTSFLTGDPVGVEVGLRVGNTLLLTVAAMGVACLIAFPLGIAAGANRGSWLDRAVIVLATLGMSLPNFWLGLLLVLLFSLSLGWLPSSGYGTAAHLVLPALVAGTSLAGVIARYIRGAVAGELPRDYVRTGRTKGLARTALLLRHVLPNTMVGVLTLLGLQAARTFDSLIVVETVFGWPGLGRLLVESVLGRDFPVMQACVMAVGVAYIAIHLAVDLLATVVDPRLQQAV